MNQETTTFLQIFCEFLFYSHIFLQMFYSNQAIFSEENSTAWIGLTPVYVAPQIGDE